MTSLKLIERTPDSEAGNDALLVARIRDGDTEASRELVRRHMRAALALARAILDNEADAEDACQDAFATVFMKLDRFDTAYAFRPWLLTIVRHRALGILRRRHVRRTVVLGTDVGEVDAHAPARDDPYASAVRAEFGERVAAAISTLTRRERQILLLHDIEGWKHPEIAVRLGVRPVTARTTLMRARRRMRTALGAADWLDAA